MMKVNKLLNILMMFVILSGTTVSFTSCGSDDDDPPIKPNTGNNGGGSDNSEGWNTDPSMLRTVASYYVGTWYNYDELSIFLVARQQGDTNRMKSAIEKGLIFNADGTGYQVYYLNSSSNADRLPFTWKVLKTLRPGKNTDCLSIKFQNCSADNIVIYNSTWSSISNTDRTLLTVSYDYGNGEYDECHLWSDFVRYNGTLRW